MLKTCILSLKKLILKGLKEVSHKKGTILTREAPLGDIVEC